METVDHAEGYRRLRIGPAFAFLDSQPVKIVGESRAVLAGDRAGVAPRALSRVDDEHLVRHGPVLLAFGVPADERSGSIFNSTAVTEAAGNRHFAFSGRTRS